MIDSNSLSFIDFSPHCNYLTVGELVRTIYWWVIIVGQTFCTIIDYVLLLCEIVCEKFLVSQLINFGYGALLA
jgi:hypothetical protein